MTVQVTIGRRGFPSLRDRVLRMVKNVQDFRVPFRVIDAKVVQPFFKKQFETGGRFGGQPWAELSEATKAARQRPGGNRGGVDRPLWDTADLKRSLHTPGPNAIREFAKFRYARGTRLARGAYHQTGYTILRWGNVIFDSPRDVPARPIIPEPLPEFLLEAIEAPMERHAFGAVLEDE